MVTIRLVGDHNTTHLCVPTPIGALGKFSKDESQQILVNVECRLDDMIKKKIVPNGFRIHSVLGFEETIVVIS